MREVVTEDNYKQIVLKRMIILCWVILLVCFVIKLFGGNFFAYIGESDTLDFINDHKVLQILFQFIVYCFGTLLVLDVVYNHNHKLVQYISCMIMFIAKSFIDFGKVFIIIAYVVEFFGLIILPIILKRKWYDVLYINLLVLAYMVISTIVKNLSIFEFPYTQLSGVVYLLDYYIMLVLMHLYSIKGEITIMKIGIWFLSKEKAQLEEYKKIVNAKHEKKIAKLNDKHAKKIAKIDAKIAKVEK